ncbi:MAG: alpha/beta hydrolase, partial [Thermoguttaceae bacterium]
PGLAAKKGAGPVGRAALRLAGAVGLRNYRVTIPLQDRTLFTASTAWQTYVAHDPLALRQVTVGFALADLELTRYATAAPQEIDMPTLLMLAGRDRIIDNRRVRALIERFASADKQVIEYAEAAHTFDFERDPAPFYADLGRWARRVATAG